MEKPNSGHEHLKKTHVVDEKEIQWIFKKKIKLSPKDGNVFWLSSRDLQLKPLCKSYMSEGLREQGLNAS